MRQETVLRPYRQSVAPLSGVLLSPFSDSNLRWVPHRRQQEYLPRTHRLPLLGFLSRIELAMVVWRGGPHQHCSGLISSWPTTRIPFLLSSNCFIASLLVHPVRSISPQLLYCHLEWRLSFLLPSYR